MKSMKAKFMYYSTIKRCLTVVMTGLCNNQHLLLFPDLPSALCQIIVASSCGS